MKWSESAWESIQPVYNKILQQPFISELMNGTLDRQKFEFYIQQDALYLAEFTKVLSIVASKLDKSEHISAFLYFAKNTIFVEQVLHESFFKEYSVNALAEASPACLFYTSYLHRQSANAPVEVALAAILPCFWIYREVGDYILKNQTNKENNPYQKWINTYGGVEYSADVDRAIAICNELAENCTEKQRQVMTETFVMCSKFEWMFWDSAWRLEKWSI